MFVPTPDLIIDRQNLTSYANGVAHNKDGEGGRGAKRENEGNDKGYEEERRKREEGITILSYYNL